MSFPWKVVNPWDILRGSWRLGLLLLVVALASGPTQTAHSAGSMTGSSSPNHTRNGNVAPLQQAAPRPVAIEDTARMVQGEAKKIRVLANDLNPAGGLRVTSVTQPAHGKVRFPATGWTVYFISAADASGPEIFSYTVTDINGNSSTALVTVNVSPRPEAMPVALSARQPTGSFFFALTPYVIVPAWLVILLLDALIAAAVWFNHRRFGTWMTPFNLLAVPYAVIATAATFFSQPLGFIPISSASFWIWGVGLLYFFLAGLPVMLLYGDTIRNSIGGQKPLQYLRTGQWIAIGLGWGVILLLVFRFVSIGGFSAMADEAGYSAAMGRGLVGHARVLSYLLVTLLVGTLGRRQWFGWLTALLLLILFLLYPVKSWLYIPLIAGLILRVTTGRMHLSITRLILVGVVAIPLFFLSYLFTFAARNPASIFTLQTYTDLARHVALYFFAGVLGWSGFLQQMTTLPDPDPGYVFQPLLNAMAVLSGTPIDRIAGQYWVVIGDQVLMHSNVHAFFGTLAIYLGYPMALLYGAVAGLLLHFLFAFAVIRRNSFILATWSFMAAPLVFGWFNLYYMHLVFAEILVYGAMLATVAWFASRWLPDEAPHDSAALTPTTHSAATLNP
ncbi:MAG: hypothetical protein IPK16_12170 [Anaerolineales bacterium]|nr:hypothetical protein [Anaerolineales bacterium]